MKVMKLKDLYALLTQMYRFDSSYLEAEVWLFTDEEGNGARPLLEGMVGIDVMPEDVDYYGFPSGSLLIG